MGLYYTNIIKLLLSFLLLFIQKGTFQGAWIKLLLSFLLFIYTQRVFRGAQSPRYLNDMMIGMICLIWLSQRVHLHVVAMLRFMSDINQPSLPTPFYSVLASVSVFMALSTAFHSINFPDNFQFSYFCFSGLLSALLVLSTIYLFLKVSFSPDIVHSGLKTPVN